jgi:hypothetical protein
MILNVIKAEYLSEFKIKVLFNDGIEKTIDLKNYINAKKHPFFKPLKQINEFKKFKVYKTIVWDSRADIAPEYLKNV